MKVKSGERKRNRHTRTKVAEGCDKRAKAKGKSKRGDNNASTQWVEYCFPHGCSVQHTLVFLLGSAIQLTDEWRPVDSLFAVLCSYVTEWIDC